MAHVVIMLHREYQLVRCENFLKDLEAALSKEAGVTVKAQISSAISSSPVFLSYFDFGGFVGEKATQIMEAAKPVVYKHFGVVKVESTMNANLVCPA